MACGPSGNVAKETGTAGDTPRARARTRRDHDVAHCAIPPIDFPGFQVCPRCPCRPGHRMHQSCVPGGIMAGEELTQFQNQLALAERNIENIRGGVDAINDIITPVQRGLRLLDTIANAAEKIDKIVDGLEKASNLAGKVSPIANVAKRIEDVLEQVAIGTEQMQARASVLADRAEPVLVKLTNLKDGLTVTEIELFRAELQLLSTLRLAEGTERAIEGLANRRDENGNPRDVTNIQTKIDSVVAPGNTVLETINGNITGTASTIGRITNLFDPPGFDFDVIIDTGETFDALTDALDVLVVPFEALQTVIEPIEAILDAVDALYNFIVAPVVDPILEAFGLQALMEEVSDQLLGLLPNVDALNPLDGFFNEFDTVLSGLDLTLSGPQFVDELGEFLNIQDITKGIDDLSSATTQGLPFDFDRFGLADIDPEFWTIVQSGTRTAGADGGIMFAGDAGVSLVGAEGSDVLIGGLGDDMVTSPATGAATDVDNYITGGGGNDMIFAYGDTTVAFQGNVDEYIIAQGKETSGLERDYVDLQHLAKAGDPTSDGIDRIYFDDETSIAFGRVLNENLTVFLRGYQAADINTPDLFGDRDKDGNKNTEPLRDFLIGGLTDFTSPGSAQANLLVGYKLDDFLSGGKGNDTLIGGPDNDYMVGGEGFDVLSGDEGIDTASFADLNNPVTITPNPGGPTPFGSDTNRGVQVYLDMTQRSALDLGLYLTDSVGTTENIVGSQFDDIIFGQSYLDNALLGEDGHDFLRGVNAVDKGNLIDGGRGNDAIVIDSGRDIAFGGQGDDVFYVALNSADRLGTFVSTGSTIDGGSGNDLLNFSPYNSTAIFGDVNPLDGELLFKDPDNFGAELNLRQTMADGHIEVDAAALTVTRVLGSGERATDTFQNIEAILGSQNADIFTAGETETPIELYGGAANDLFLGVGWGIDSQGNRDFDAEGNALFGGGGDDTFKLQGSYEIHAGSGYDTIDLSTSQDGFWVLDLTGLKWDSRDPSTPSLAVFETRDELPNTRDIFVDARAAPNADPLPLFYDPSDPNNDPRPVFTAPLDDVGQEVTGIEAVIGTDRDDIILGGREVADIFGGDGDDFLAVRFDDDPGILSPDYPEQTIRGGNGDDHIVGHYGDEFLYGDAGNDIIDLVANRLVDPDANGGVVPISRAFGGDGADLFHALDYNIDGQIGGIQEIDGGEHFFEVTNEDGSTRQVEYQDAVDFGDGEVSLLNDLQATGVRVDLSGTLAGYPGFQAKGVVLRNIENVFGTRFNDDIRGDDEDNVLIGRDGNDELRGAGGDDILISGAGDSQLFGNAGNDIFMAGVGDGNRFNGNTEVSGGEGIDTISYEFLRPDGRGSSAIAKDAVGKVFINLDDTFSGRTFASFTSDLLRIYQEQGISVDSGNYISRTDLIQDVGGLSDIENATGGRRDDDIDGNALANVLNGGAGDDSLRGRDGNDTLIVGTGDDMAQGDGGDDLIFGAEGNNSFDGGAGDADELNFSGNTLGLSFDLDTGNLLADFTFSTQVFKSKIDGGGTLAERAAHTLNAGSNDPRSDSLPVIGVLDITAADVFKIDNPAFADSFIHLDQSFVQSVLQGDGTLLPNYDYVTQSEVRTFTNSVEGFERFIAGEGDDLFTYSAGTGFKGYFDAGLGTDTLDLRGLAGAVDFDVSGAVRTLTVDGIAQGLSFKNVERILTDGGDIGINTDPFAVDDTGTTSKFLAFTTVNVLDNDSDANGDTLSIAGLDTTGTLGLVTNNNDGTFAYDPTGAFNGLSGAETATDSFRYTVSDGNGGTDEGIVTITVTAESAAPVAADDDGFSTDEDMDLVIDPSALLANDSGGAATLTRVFDGDNGTVALNGDGDIVFTPDGDANGNASFRYEIQNADGAASAATVRLVIDPVNDLPEISGLPSIIDIREDTPAGLDLTSTALADADGDTLELALVVSSGALSAPSGGGVTVGGSAETITLSGCVDDLNTFLGDAAAITYTPEHDLTGAAVATIAVKLDDGTGQRDAGSIRLDIEAVNDRPVLNDLDGDARFVMGGGPVGLDDDVTVDDTELGAENSGDGDFAGANLRLQRHTGVDADDLFSVVSGGNITVAGGPLTGGTISAGGDVIAIILGTGAGVLRIFFENNGTPPATALVNEVLQAIRYESASGTPETDVPVRWTFSDGNGSDRQGSGANPGAVTEFTTVSVAPNTPATITGDTTGEVTEDSVLTAAGNLNHTDPDAGDTDDVWSTTIVSQGVRGTAQITADGQWTYDLDNTDPVVQALGDGEALTDTFQVATGDGTTQGITITVTGSAEPNPGGGPGDPDDPLDPQQPPAGDPVDVALDPGSPVEASQTVSGGTGDAGAFAATLENLIGSEGGPAGGLTVTEFDALLASLGDSAPPVRTITLSVPDGTDPAEIQSIIVDAGNTAEFLILDVTSLPPGTDVTLNNASVVFVNGPAVLGGGLGDTVLFGTEDTQIAVLGPGNDVLFGGDGNDTLGSLGGFDLINGEAGNDTLSGGADADRFIVGSGADTVRGESGDDHVFVTGGTHQIFGGAGVDTIVFDGTYDAATLSLSGAEVDVAGTSRMGNAYSTTLSDVEILVFSDRTVHFKTGASDPAGQVIRLYEGLLGRAPDTSGAGLHLRLLESGAASLPELAAVFVASQEFADRFGNPDTLSNSAFVTQLYLEILGREPEAGGLAHHEALLASGILRGDLASAFIQSAEFGAAADNSTALGLTGDRLANVTGTAANEILAGTYFDDTVDGGEGIDTFAVAALRAEVMITQAPNGDLSLSDTYSLIGADTLYGIERIEFLDGTLAFNPADSVAHINRLSQVVLDRDMAAEPLGQFVRAVDAGQSTLADVAGALLASSEFTNQAALSDNSALVSLFYENGLERTPDDAGLAHWIAALDAGLSAEGFAVLIASSAEAVGLTPLTPEDGLFFV